VKDRVETGELSVEFCPTEQMLADFFTKPLQGSLFKIFRDRIMNHNPDHEPSLDYRSVLDEAESEARTDDEWTLVQCKCRSGSKCYHEVGLVNQPKCAESHDNNKVREQNRFTMLNECSNWGEDDDEDNVNTFKESNHEREENQVRGDDRERDTIRPAEMAEKKG